MQIDFSALGPLADAVEKAGAPILAAALRAGSAVSTDAPFPLNLILPTVLNGLADALGGSADDPSGLCDKLASDPDAAAKIKAVEDTHKDDLQSSLDFARLQVEQNDAAFAAAMPIWAKILFAGARPLQMWLTGPCLTLYQLCAATGHFAPIDPANYAIMSAQFAMLAGTRTYEKAQGLASPAPVIPAPVKRILKRAVK
jgi:hypothetical protein